MNAAEIERCRQQLVRLKVELSTRERAAGDTGKPVELDQSRVGRLSRMDAMQAQEMALESARRRQQQAARIDGALRRIDAGEFGLCFVCREEMDSRRLRADPTHTRCVRCAAQ